MRSETEYFKAVASLYKHHKLIIPWHRLHEAQVPRLKLANLDIAMLEMLKCMSGLT